MELDLADGAPTEDLPVNPPAAKVAPRRMLVVEDHEATRDVLCRLLARRGHEVTTAGTMAEGLERFKAGEFDLVLSDLGLPDGNGMELVSQMRRIRPVCAIALSGYGMEEDVRRAKEAGFSAHLVKPVNMDQLELLLAQLATR